MFIRLCSDLLSISFFFFLSEAPWRLRFDGGCSPSAPSAPSFRFWALLRCLLPAMWVASSWNTRTIEAPSQHSEAHRSLLHQQNTVRHTGHCCTSTTQRDSQVTAAPAQHSEAHSHCCSSTLQPSNVYYVNKSYNCEWHK